MSTPEHPPRFVTAASLFDGHDASINIIRRLLQFAGAEVIHLGHNRSVKEVVDAAIQENVQAVAVSSYQGGHNESFRYMIDMLRRRGAEHIKIFGGGGGVITPSETAALETYGVTRIYSPQDGQRLGLKGIIQDVIERTGTETKTYPHTDLQPGDCRNHLRIAQALSDIELQAVTLTEPLRTDAPIIAVTGTGGAGKSSLTDELILRFSDDFPDHQMAVISVDPTKRKSGGALLGDRIRINSATRDTLYMRSFASRGHGGGLTPFVPACVQALDRAGFDLIFVESTGIGQGDASVLDLGGISLYVMTADFGAPSQLEKIDMIDYADVIAVNKYERPGSEDAYRDVLKQYQRTHCDDAVAEPPLFGTIASQFNDPGVNALYRHLCAVIQQRYGTDTDPARLTERPSRKASTKRDVIIPSHRSQYLAEIASTVRDYHQRVDANVELARRHAALSQTCEILSKTGGSDGAAERVDRERQRIEDDMDPALRDLLASWPDLKSKYQGQTYCYEVRGQTKTVTQTTTTLSGSSIPKVVPPRHTSAPELLRFLAKENLPGFFPYTAGIYPFKRVDEDPKRQFAGEGTPARTNTRFHYLSESDNAKRLSTAFDAVTLYGHDPDRRPDIYGKVGESGVSVCTLDDMKALYAGFDLCHPSTSVSMTINGPAPIILAMFLNTAIAQQIDRFRDENHRPPTRQEAETIEAETLRAVRGTVQADILKEDQAQNTCIFSLDFALKMMGDIQETFIKRNIRNFYSVSISGYHMAEAGANPITQLALTLANGFTYVEYYLARGMDIDDFAPNLSFFFSNGLDPEYTVLGRVARRIWSIAMRDRYGADGRSQKLKYHIQTSGRSLHSQEIHFNDIRTTLQGLTAMMDNCNSLHTNSYDEAITTPTAESVRRAMAIQQIVQREFGITKNENPLQGSFMIEELTDLVEKAVLDEFDRISRRGGVLGAIETQYQRSRIQAESLHYEQKKDSGELPIIGVNTFLDPDQTDTIAETDLVRATVEDKECQLSALEQFHEKHRSQAGEALSNLKRVILSGENIFEELMKTVQVCSLGQIATLLHEIGGQYRRNT